MSQRNDIVNKAIEFLDYTEGPNNDTIFGDWYGLPNQPWCAMFISYIADQVGISQEIIKKFASCTAGFNWFNEQGRAVRANITPKVGDIIFFVWSNPDEPTPDHVGIVEKVENGRVYTIEGNRSDKVQRFSYDINSWQIYGYAFPNYIEDIEIDIDEIAHDVILGEYGNGAERKEALGDLYDEVQNRVNEILSYNNPPIEELAKAVIRGVYGNGAERKEALGELYDEVQAKVNEILRGE